MGWDNYLILKDGFDDGLEQELKNANPAASMTHAHVWNDGTIPAIVGSDCSETLATKLGAGTIDTCVVCGHKPCAGCGEQFVLDLRETPATLTCVGCIPAGSIWEVLQQKEFPKNS